jgi:hypothetical protein
MTSTVGDGVGVGALVIVETGAARLVDVVATWPKSPPEGDGAASTGDSTKIRGVEDGTAGEGEEDATAAAATAVAGVPEEGKLALAVTTRSGLTSTLLTITTSPSILVTFTSTVVVPNPLEFSKKL